MPVKPARRSSQDHIFPLEQYARWASTVEMSAGQAAEERMAGLIIATGSGRFPVLGRGASDRAHDLRGNVIG